MYLLKKNKYGLIFDMHSYNYQREGVMPWYIDDRPVINIGTGAVNRQVFAHIIETFIGELKKISIGEHNLYVGENIIFKGGYLSRRLLKNHFYKLLFIAVEFKKIFMNELSGDLYENILTSLLGQYNNALLSIINNPFFKK